MSDFRLFALTRFRHNDGHCWIADLDPSLAEGDTLGHPSASPSLLFEDGRQLAPNHSLHADIVASGMGRYSHWGHVVYFSSSDGTSPSENRRSYTALVADRAVTAQERELRTATGALRADLSDYERYLWAERVFNIFAPGIHVSEFGRSYFRDTEFARDYERFAEANYRAYDRRFTLVQFARLAARLPGHFAECGVYSGMTAHLLSRTLIRSGADSVDLHLFDSFAGLSAPTVSDGSFWKSGDMAVSLAKVQALLADYVGKIRYHPGWIPERFPEVTDKTFSFVHLDVDLYQPTHDAIFFFYPRLVDRGILLCDDYGFETCPGARRAMDEFFADKPETVVHLPTGQGLVMRKEG